MGRCVSAAEACVADGSPQRQRQGREEGHAADALGGMGKVREKRREPGRKQTVISCMLHHGIMQS